MNEENKKEYKSLYRRWRPEKFEHVVGQEKAIRILKNSVIRDNIANAYLFAGPRGTGKTSVARIMAKAINCENRSGGEPCNDCSSCRKIETEQALDVIEIDGASNRGINEIRELREEVNYMPAEAKYKVYIIDEVHMLTNEAFNALLKTLEEPPERVLFVFATTEPQKIPETIVSRCQVFEFRELPPELIQNRVEKVAAEEGVEIKRRALRLIAKKGRGSMRDALVVLEQMISYKTDDEITEEDLTEVLGVTEEETIEEYLRGISEAKPKKALDTISDISAKGKDFELFLEDLLDKLREGIVKGPSESNLDLPKDKLISFARKTLDLLNEIRYSTNKRLSLEIGTLEALDSINEGEVAEERADVDRKEKTEKETEEEKPQKEETGGAKKTGGDPSGTWGEVVEEVSEQRISIGAFLQEGNMKEKDEEIVLEFHPDFSFHKESLERRENFQFLQKVIDRHYGENYELKLKYNSEIEKMEKNEEPDLVEEKTEMVKNKFDGRVIERSKDLL